MSLSKKERYISNLFLLILSRKAKDLEGRDEGAQLDLFRGARCDVRLDVCQLAHDVHLRVLVDPHEEDEREQLRDDVLEREALRDLDLLDLRHGVPERQRAHELEHAGDVLRGGLPRRLVDALLGDHVVREPGRLEHVQDAPHVPAPDADQGLDAVGRHGEVLGGAHAVDALAHGGGVQRGETEACAAGLDGWDDLVDVVAYKAEAGPLGVLLDDC